MASVSLSRWRGSPTRMVWLLFAACCILSGGLPGASASRTLPRALEAVAFSASREGGQQPLAGDGASAEEKEAPAPLIPKYEETAFSYATQADSLLQELVEMNSDSSRPVPGGKRQQTQTRKKVMWTVAVLVTVILSSIMGLCCCFYMGTAAKPSKPYYWSAGKWAICNDDYYEEVDVTEERKDVIQRILDITTQVESMGSRREGSWATHQGFEVLKVTRIENGKVWSDYAVRRKRMLSISETLSLMDPDAKATAYKTLGEVDEALAVMQADPDVSRFLDTLGMHKDRNECVMFHGSPGPGARNAAGSVMFDQETRTPRNCIKQQGFDERLGSVKGMFGSGCYFADRASKADQYAGRYSSKPGETGSNGQVATMFLSRVCLGVPYMTDQSLEQLRRPPCIDGKFDMHLSWNKETIVGKPWREKGVKFEVCGHARFDSVMGSTLIDGRPQHYREYVIYERQAYPEFCVTYRRTASRPPVA